MAFSWLEAEGGARLLVDEELKILWGNATARSWLADRQSLAEIQGCVCFGRYTPDIRKLVGRALLKPEGTCVPVPAIGGHIIVCARLLGLDGHSNVFGLTLRRTDQVEAETPMGIAEAFGLTSAELRVLKSLSAGETAQETAGDLKVSVDTVRTHIRRVYQKVGVNSREALFTRVRPFMVML
jgi:DNA-binding CsgD family transcriptional regulator